MDTDTTDTWERMSGRCGGCVKFERDFGDDSRAYGHCNVKPRTGAITSLDFKCDVYRPHPSVADEEPSKQAPTRNPFADPLNATRHPPKKRRRVAAPQAERKNPAEVRRRKRQQVNDQSIDLGDESMDRGTLREIIQEAIEDTLGIGEVELLDRFQGGSVTVNPGIEGTQPKEIPIDSLMRKIISIRDNLRVLEQKINSHSGLEDGEKIQMQQYITRCYGSLTTFNSLFKYKEDHFKGS